MRAHVFAYLITAAAILLVGSGPSRAEHEADHRYDVRGYVLSEQKQGRSGVPVTVLMGGEVIGSGRTDAEGYYSIRLHLHDSDIGRTLLVRAGKRQADIRMTATPGDTSTHRIHHVNFIGGEMIQEELARSGVPAWAYFAGAPVVLWAAYYAGSTARRKLRAMKKAKAKAIKKGKRIGKR